jgi:hypothetical protein
VPGMVWSRQALVGHVQRGDLAMDTTGGLVGLSRNRKTGKYKKILNLVIQRMNSQLHLSCHSNRKDNIFHDMLVFSENQFIHQIKLKQTKIKKYKLSYNGDCNQNSTLFLCLDMPRHQYFVHYQYLKFIVTLFSVVF